MIIDTTQATFFDFRVTGHVHVALERDNRVIYECDQHNLVMDSGRNYIANRIAYNSPLSGNGDASGIAKVGYMAIGVDSSNSTATNITALVNQTGTRVTTTVSVATNTVTYTGIFETNNGSGEIKEAGLFNDSTATTGSYNMLARTTFGVITKVANSDKLTLTWTLTVS